MNCGAQLPSACCSGEVYLGCGHSAEVCLPGTLPGAFEPGDYARCATLILQHADVSAAGMLCVMHATAAGCRHSAAVCWPDEALVCMCARTLSMLCYQFALVLLLRCRSLADDLCTVDEAKDVYPKLGKPCRSWQMRMHMYRSIEW